MLNKDVFIEMVNEWKQSYDEKYRFEKAIGTFCNEPPILRLGTRCRDALAKLIGVTCGFYDEEDDLLYWWAFEEVDKKISVLKDGNLIVYDVATVDGLYEYVVANYGDSH